MTLKLTRRGFQLSALAAGLTAGTARAQEWPTQSVKVIIPFAPGGSTDALSRPVLERLDRNLGQPFVIENHGGAGSVVGTTMVANARPDGNTLLINTPSFLSAMVLQDQGYSLDSFTPIAMLAASTYVILVPAESPIQDVADLIEAAKAKNGNLLYATAGSGSSTHFVTEYFCMASGVRMKHVPFRGIGPAMLGLLAGDADVIFTTPASGAAQIQGGLVRVLAYTSVAGGPSGYPQATTVRETGLDFDAAGWFVMLGPKGLAPELQAKIGGAVNDILNTPEIAEIYAGLGARPYVLTPQEVDAALHSEMQLWSDVAKFANITAG